MANAPATILNASTIPLNTVQGTIPNVSGAMLDYFQVQSFLQVTKTVVGFVVSETVVTTQFWGVMLPRTKNLDIKEIGERFWGVWDCYAQVQLPLQVDDVIQWQGKQFRVLARDNFGIYGFYHYALTEDWQGSLPTP